MTFIIWFVLVIIKLMCRRGENAQFTQENMSRSWSTEFYGEKMPASEIWPTREIGPTNKIGPTRGIRSTRAKYRLQVIQHALWVMKIDKISNQMRLLSIHMKIYNPPTSIPVQFEWVQSLSICNVRAHALVCGWHFELDKQNASYPLDIIHSLYMPLILITVFVIFD